MNLIHDPWIPVLFKSGKRGWIRPAEIAKQDDPPLRIASPRPDFNGTLVQFLIGLLQTTFAPEDLDDWLDRLESPPDVAALDEAFSSVDFAFEFDAPSGPRFMQDLEPLENNSDAQPIGWLLIGAPTDNTIDQNRDFFVKRDSVSGLCARCTAMALFTLQTNAPSGGRGHRTSIRGGGPLTTLPLFDEMGEEGKSQISLWRMVWMSVLDKRNLVAPSASYEKWKKVFPWLTGEFTGEKVTPDMMHPLHVFWGMPRRIRIDFDEKKNGKCDLCGENGELILNYHTCANGINYEGPWKHPLSPYYEKGNDVMPMHPQPGGITYRYWLDITMGVQTKKRVARAAEVVREFHRRIADAGLNAPQFRVWAFGFDMENMKARCWYEAEMPVYHVKKEVESDFSIRVDQMVSAADLVAGYLADAAKKVLIGDNKKGGGDNGKRKKSNGKASVFGVVKEQFFFDTEGRFFQLLPLLASCMETGRDRDILSEWYEYLKSRAIAYFDDSFATDEMVFAYPERVADARKQLVKKLHGSKIK